MLNKINKKTVANIAEIQKSSDVVTNDLAKEISTPPPLRASREFPQSYLAPAGVITLTNNERAKIGLRILAENEKLDAEAKLKVKDMFANQYFEHVSPVTSKSAGDLVEFVGYQYIAVGENLALGNYKDDRDLLKAWMDSPGHRANILNPRYREIGVAVMQGIFQGHQTWLAVQTFAKPLSACSQPDTALKSQITALENQVDTLKSQAESEFNGVNEAQIKTGDEYKQKTDKYNTLVNQINTLISQLKTQVEQYNIQVTKFNTCVAG